MPCNLYDLECSSDLYDATNQQLISEFELKELQGENEVEESIISVLKMLNDTEAETVLRETTPAL